MNSLWFDTVAGNWTRPGQDTAMPFILSYETVAYVQNKLNLIAPEAPSRKTIPINQERLNFKVKKDRNKDSFYGSNQKRKQLPTRTSKQEIS